MKALRDTLLAAFLAVGALPGWAAAAAPAPPAPPPPPGQQQDLQQRLDQAQQRLAEASREVARLSAQLGRNMAFQIRTQDGGPAPRALLGVSIDNNSGDARGAHVRDVSPGSAAAEAGIKAGDVITNIGGKDLTSESDAGRALVDQMSQVEPNLKLKVDVLRDGKKMSFDVTPRPAPVRIFGGVQRMPDMPDMGGVHTFQLQRGPVGPGQPRIEIREFRSDDDKRFRGLEFATLSEKLGSYFGVKSGVLVVRAGENSPFKLQDGDVILSIDGREPTTAQHAGRILHSYGDGEKLKLHIERNHKKMDLNVVMPGNGPGADHED